MLSITKTTNMSGTSTIGGKQVVYMTATIQTDGRYNTNYAVQDVELKRNNNEEVERDMREFEGVVEGVAGEVTT